MQNENLVTIVIIIFITVQNTLHIGQFSINGQTIVVKTIVYHFSHTNEIVLDSFNYVFYKTST